MRKTTGILTGVVVLASGILLFFNGPASNDSQSPNPAPSPQAAEEIDNYEPLVPPTDDNKSLTQAEFDQLSEEQQDRMLEAFVIDFWEKELGLSDETRPVEKGLSLEIFNRPYMQTLTEREFSQLSPEDQQNAIAEVVENCSQVRSYINGVIAEAESCMADRDYLSAEACFAHSVEVGRELSANKDGLIITRLAGMACEKLGLNGLVKLYAQTGDNAKVQMAREQLSEIESEVQEIKAAAKQSEANR